MEKQVIMIALIMITTSLSGCTEAQGRNSNVENFHLYIDGSSDISMCQTAVVLKDDEFYYCTFTLDAEEYIVVELDVDSDSDPVDLITMDDINYQKWVDMEDYYYLEDWTDFTTFGGQYGKDVLMPEGDWNIVVWNVPYSD
tara:strand:+ start:52 stop:474 length:423 start_codon:yes stop_codon:yes gene_type:complete